MNVYVHLFFIFVSAQSWSIDKRKLVIIFDWDRFQFIKRVKCKRPDWAQRIGLDLDLDDVDKRVQETRLKFNKIISRKSQVLQRFSKCCPPDSATLLVKPIKKSKNSSKLSFWVSNRFIVDFQIWPIRWGSDEMTSQKAESSIWKPTSRTGSNWTASNALKTHYLDRISYFHNSANVDYSNKKLKWIIPFSYY